MRKITAFNLSILGYVIRFYIMMASVVILGFLGQFVLATFAGFALAVSFILGVRLEKVPDQIKAARSRKLSEDVFTAQEAA